MRAYPHQLSGGQRQRVMIAMALACRPSLIIADEPTTALDVMVQAQILDLLSGLVRDLGVGMMIISHDLSVLADVCDRVVVMYAGRVVETGTAEQVFTDPQHPYTPRPLRAPSRASATGPPATRPTGLAGDPPDPRRASRPVAPSRRGARVSIDQCREAEPPLLAARRDARGRVRPGGGAVSTRRSVARTRSPSSRRATSTSTSPPARGRSRAPSTAPTCPYAGGEIVALVGESGSGKTTLARTLMGLQRPSGRRGPLRRRAARLLDPEPAPLPQPGADGAPGRGRVAEPAPDRLRVGGRGHPAAPPGRRRPRGTRPRSTWSSAAMSDAGLRPPERLFLRYPHELSGGQKQRVLIAGALALRPHLLIADEPVSSLDASIRGEILALLLRLREELGLGIVVVTHDLGLAWNIADRIAVMYLGRVVESGTTEEVLESPRHPYTKALLSVVPEMEELRAGRAHRRDPGPDADPRRLPLPPSLPGAGRRQRRGRGRRRAVPDRAAGHAARRRRAPRRLPPRRGAARPGPAVTEDEWRALAGPFVDGAYATVKGRVRTHVLHQQLLRHLPAPPAAVLDVGGGAGHQSVPLARLGHDVTILDPSEAMLDKAADRLAGEPEEVRSRVRLVQAAASPRWRPPTAVGSRWCCATAC